MARAARAKKRCARFRMCCRQVCRPCGALDRQGLQKSARGWTLSIMVTLDDTCLLHRGGRAALDTAQQGAACVLSMGGSSTLAGLLELGRLHQRLMRLWASPGGSADLLAATLFLDRLSSVERRDQHDGDV
jgi:triphosphoribosyl-dephospho-CoA synthetase